MTDTPTNAAVSELLPCPWCEQPATISRAIPSVPIVTHFGAPHCVVRRDAAFTIAQWNFRAAAPPSVDEVEAVARAIACARWDAACSALGTPCYVRGSDWQAFTRDATAAMSARSPVGWEDEAAAMIKRLRAPAGEVENAMLCVEAADLLQKIAGVEG